MLNCRLITMNALENIHRTVSLKSSRIVPGIVRGRAGLPSPCEVDFCVGGLGLVFSLSQGTGAGSFLLVLNRLPVASIIQGYAVEACSFLCCAWW
jgi:hypothetical protein